MFTAWVKAEAANRERYNPEQIHAYLLFFVCFVTKYYTSIACGVAMTGHVTIQVEV